MHEEYPAGPATRQPSGLGDPHHLAYVVEDLALAARQWHEVTGIGPFLVLPHVAFDSMIVDGQATIFDHTPAFAAHGGLFIELQLIHHIEPAASRARFTPRAPGGVHHAAYVVDDLAAQSARLTALGLPCTIRAKAGDLQVAMHDASDLIGATLELHQDSAFLRSFFEQVRVAPDTWDGRQLLIEP
jgi:hypothetical protein